MFPPKKNDAKNVTSGAKHAGHDPHAQAKDGHAETQTSTDHTAVQNTQDCDGDE